MFLERKDTLLDQTEDTAVLLDFFDARHFGRIGRKQASFHVFQLIFQIRNDGHEAGHDAVQDHAEQKVCLSVADLEHIFLQSRVDFVQHLGFFFDEREQEVLSLNDTKLLRQIIIVFFRSQLFQDDYIIIFMFFDFGQERQEDIKETLKTVYESLEEKGYNPINQIVGYLLSGDPAYFPRLNDARNLIRQHERDEIIEELVRSYLKNNGETK